MSEPLWQLLLKRPSALSCPECFAVIEFYAGILAQRGPDVLPRVLEHLQGCPSCPGEYDRSLQRLEDAYGSDEANTE